jgi:hypothetical protein
VRRRQLTVLAVALALTGCGSAGEPRAPFLPAAVRALAPARVLTPSSLRPAVATAARAGLARYEYVFVSGGFVVYDVHEGFSVAERVRIPEAGAYRGVVVSLRTGELYLSVGGNGGSSGHGSLIAYSLRRDAILWERRFPTGTDNPAITPDGKTIFLPTGERSRDDVWWVVDARDGRVTGEIHAGLGPHNTIIMGDGRRVYLGPRNGRFLAIASTSTGRVIMRVGPLASGVRPFTINGAQTLAYTTATGFFGFQVSSLRTGRVLDTIRLGNLGFHWRPGPGAPNHGIALTRDSRDLYLLDVPNSVVHVFDVSGVPRRPPRPVATVALTRPMVGLESPCIQDCGRAGWLGTSVDGRYLYVGDEGDVISTSSLRIVAFLPALWNSRYMLEIDWRHGRPVATSTRSGVGSPTSRSRR